MTAFRETKKPAAHFAFDMTVDLDQALGRNISFDLQAFCNDGFSTPEKHEMPPVRYQKPISAVLRLIALYGAACTGFTDPVSEILPLFSLAMLSSNTARSLDN